MRFTNDALWPIKRFRMHNPSVQPEILLLLPSFPRVSLFLFFLFFIYLLLGPSPRTVRLFHSVCVSYDYTRAINRYLETSLRRRLSVASVRPTKRQGRGSLINGRFRCGLPRTLIPEIGAIVNRSIRSWRTERWKILKR